MRTEQEINNDMDSAESDFHAGRMTDEQYNSRKKELREELKTTLLNEGAQSGQERATYDQQVKSGWDLVQKKGQELAVRIHGENPSKLLVTGAQGALNNYYNEIVNQKAKKEGIPFNQAMPEILHKLTEEDVNKAMESVLKEHQDDEKNSGKKTKPQSSKKAGEGQDKGEPEKTHADDAAAAKEAGIEDGAGGGSITPDEAENKDVKTISEFIENPAKNKFSEGLEEFTNAMEAAARMQASMDGGQQDVFVRHSDGSKHAIS